MDTVRVAVIGVGKMGQNHLRVLSMLRGVEISFIYDSNAALAQKMAGTYGVRAIERLSDGELAGTDAVVIAAPTSTHADYVRKAGGVVKNLFVEKPMAASRAEAEEIASLVKARGLNVQVGFIERFNPAVDATKRVLDRSSKVISVDFTRTNKLSSRITDVDVVTDLMIHDIDLAIYLNGPVTAVSAQGVARGRMIDFASASLQHQNGSFSRIQASRVTERKMRLIQATCDDMFVDCDLLRKEIIISRQSEIRQVNGEPYTISALEESVEVRPQEALLMEVQSFIAACRGKAVDGIPGVDAALQAQVVCDSIQKAVLQ